MREGQPGSVRISRDIFDDAAFKDEPMSEREAFIWLIMEASFKAREKRIGAATITLSRGQVAASLRFMAKAWQWSEARVRRYLDRLENRRMLTCVADAGVTVITLCNYDKYQSGSRVADAAPTQEPTHHRRTADANENKDAIREVETSVSTKSASARDHLIPLIGEALADAFVAHRKALKAPMTEGAGKLMAKKLATMADPIAVVEQSIAEGWKGVFPLKSADVHHFPRRGQNGPGLDDHLDALKARVAVQRLE